MAASDSSRLSVSISVQDIVASGRRSGSSSLSISLHLGVNNGRIIGLLIRGAWYMALDAWSSRSTSIYPTHSDAHSSRIFEMDVRTGVSYAKSTYFGANSTCPALSDTSSWTFLKLLMMVVLTAALGMIGIHREHA